MLALELFLLLHSVRVVFNQALGRGDVEFANTTIVKFINRLIESLRVDILALGLQLGVKFGEFVLNRLSFNLELLVVESMLRLSVNAVLD